LTFSPLLLPTQYSFFL